MLTYQSPKSPEAKLTEFTEALKPLSTHSASQYQYQNHYFNRRHVTQLRYFVQCNISFCLKGNLFAI